MTLGKHFPHLGETSSALAHWRESISIWLGCKDVFQREWRVLIQELVLYQSIGRVITVVECYRVLDNKNREVMVRIAYNSEMAKKAVKEAVREDLKKKGEKLHEQLDKALGF